MTRKLLLLITLVSTALLGTFAACGGDDAAVGKTDGGGDGTTTDDSGSDFDSGGGDSAVSDSGNREGGGADAGPCIGLDSGCFACCAEQDPDASVELAASAIDCACNTPGDCHDACKTTLCKGSPTAPNAACLACIASADAGNCIKNAETTVCGSNASCMATVDCFTQCKN